MAQLNYAEPAEVDAVATGMDPRWLNLTAEQKQLYCTYASQDIEKYHGLPRDASGTVPALYKGSAITQAGIWQSLFVMRTVGIREWSDRADLATSQNFSDGIISRDSAGGQEMDDTAKGLVDVELANNGIVDDGAMTFGRG